MSTQQQTTKYQDFDAKDLTITKFEDNERSKGQLIGYPRFKNDGQALMLQGPWIKMNSYGVPQLGEYYKSDSDRAFIKIPLDVNSSPEVREFYEKLVNIDEVMQSKEFKNTQFGSKASKYKYVPIVRVPQDDEGEVDEKKKKYPRPPYIKVKLDTTWPETEIKTQVFTSIMKDGKREREKQQVKSVDEFANIVRFLSSIRPIIRPVKGWCEKKAKMGNDNMQYGITFKLIKIEVEPAEGSGNNLISQYMNNDAFIDSDDEDPKPKFQGKPAEVKTPLPLVKKTVVKEESEEEEEESEEDPVPEPSEEEEEEEEERIPEPPKKGKAPVKSSRSKKN